MRDKITATVNEVLENDFTKVVEIYFGYDCIAIEVHINAGYNLYIGDIVRLQEFFETETGWIKQSGNGNIILGYDISNVILKEFGSWFNYECKYGY